MGIFSKRPSRRYRQQASVYEIPFRPAFEMRSAVGWAVAALATGVSSAALGTPMIPAIIGLTGAAGLATYRYRQGYPVYRRLKAIQSEGLLWFEPEDRVLESFEAAYEKQAMWYGRGFDWTTEISEKLYYLLGPGESLVKPMEHRVTTDVGDFNGKYWLHHLDDEMDVPLPLDALKGQTLIVGTTRAGKTRLYDTLINQCIRRGEPVIIIDPKGDKELAENARRVCESLGAPERFCYFHPAHPEKSVAMDVMASWNRATGLASRIAALLAAGGDANSDPFVSFGWRVLNNFIHGLLILGNKPTLKSMRSLVEGDGKSFVLAVLKEYAIQHNASSASLHAYLTGKDGKIAESVQNQLDGYKRFYREVLSKEHPSSELEGLMADEEHDKEHFGKMIVSLTPLLAMLTSHPLDTLLSPDPKTFDGRIVNSKRVIDQDLVLYMGLDTLSDAAVGQAIGSIILADLASTAGDIYNYKEPKPVNIFVDEGAEVMNQPLIQLLNKGGGALFRVFLATQTLSDIAARLGSKDRANQVIGNTNNTIILRIIDADTQKYAADKMGEADIRRMATNYGHGVSPAPHDAMNGTYSESLTLTKGYRFPPDLFGSLPPLHFMAVFAGGRIMKCRVPIITSEAA